MFRSSISFLIVLMLSACTQLQQIRLYEGPPLHHQQESRIQLPENFDVIELNGNGIPQSTLQFRVGDVTLSLPPGPHTLVLQYSDIWDIDDETHDKLSTGNIVFKVNAQANEEFIVQYPTLKNYDDALTFIQSPFVSLKSQFQIIKGSHLKKKNPLIFNQKVEEVVRYPNLEQLKFWWQQATQYERDEFLNWRKSQTK